MRAFSLMFLLVLAALLGFLAYENSYNTTLTVLEWKWDVPFPAVIAVVYVLGMLTGWSLIAAVKQSWQRVSEPDRR